MCLLEHFWVVEFPDKPLPDEQIYNREDCSVMEALIHAFASSYNFAHLARYDEVQLASQLKIWTSERWVRLGSERLNSTFFAAAREKQYVDGRDDIYPTLHYFLYLAGIPGVNINEISTFSGWDAQLNYFFRHNENGPELFRAGALAINIAEEMISRERTMERLFRYKST